MDRRGKKSWHSIGQNIRQQQGDLLVTLPGHAEFRPLFLGTRWVPFLTTSDLEYLQVAAYEQMQTKAPHGADIHIHGMQRCYAGLQHKRCINSNEATLQEPANCFLRCIRKSLSTTSNPALGLATCVLNRVAHADITSQTPSCRP